MFKITESLDRMVETKDVHTGSLFLSPGAPAFTEIDYKNVAREGYKKNPFVYAALNLGADLFSDVELIVEQRRSGSDEWEEAPEDNPLNRLLLRPNEDQGAAAFKKEMYLFYKMSGKSYQHPISPDTGSRSGTPLQIFNIVPSDIEPISGGAAEPIQGFQMKNTGRKFERDEIIYIRDFHPTNPLNGYSGIMSAAHAIDLSNAQIEWNYSILRNSGMPAHVFQGFPSLSKAMEFKQKNQRDTGGPKNAGKDLYLPNGIDVKKLGFDTREIDWLDGMKFMMRTIYSVLGVPSELLNDGENKTYSNLENAIKAVIYHNTLPAWRVFVDEWNHTLVPRFESDGQKMRLRVDKSSIESLQENMKERIEQGVSLYEGNLANKGEARAFAGLDSDVPDAERTVLRSSFIPDDFMSEDADSVTEEEINENGSTD